MKREPSWPRAKLMVRINSYLRDRNYGNMVDGVYIMRITAGSADGKIESVKITIALINKDE